jgi:YNFM family putative membrane transporter
MAGRYLDRHGFRRTTWLSLAMCLGGLSLTLAHSLSLVIAGLAAFSSGIFVSQSAATVLMGQVAGRARSAAAGLYVTFYYVGGSAGAGLTGWFWLKGGWPGCVGLFSVVSVLTLILALVGGKSVAGRKIFARPVVETAI